MIAQIVGTVSYAIVMELIIGFVLVLTTAVVRYGHSTQYRLWAAGWILIVATSAQNTFGLPETVTPSVALSIVGMVTGTTLFLVGRKSDPEKESIVVGVLLSLVISSVYAYHVHATSTLTHQAYLWPEVYSGLGFIVMLHSLMRYPLHGLFITLLKLSIVGWIMAVMSAPLVAIWAPQLIDITLWAQVTTMAMIGAAMFALLLVLKDRAIKRESELALVLSSTIQHDIRNYLHAIIAALELARTDAENALQWVDTAQLAAEQAAAFTEEMREISASVVRDGGNRDVFDIVPVIYSIVETLTRLGGLEDCQIDIHMCDSVPVMSSRVIRQVFWNIIDCLLYTSPSPRD